MDPNATLKLILDSLVEEDSLQAIESLRDLAEWIERGGFMPVLAKTKLDADKFYYSQVKTEEG